MSKGRGTGYMYNVIQVHTVRVQLHCGRTVTRGESGNRSQSGWPVGLSHDWIEHLDTRYATVNCCVTHVHIMGKH